MRRLLLALLAALVVTVVAPEARAGVCGLPDTQPVWVEFAEGSVAFRNDVFGRPGVVAATSGALVSSALRERGAQTVAWEMKLGSFVGTTTKPADPATIDAAVTKLFNKAVVSSGCATPWIALNELNGARTTTPWTATNAQYRGNVLALLRGLAARGARPFLLVNGKPYTGGDARDWWLQAAEVADIVPELYFNAKTTIEQGVVLGSRTLRMALRAGIAGYTAIGIPASRLGIILGFQTEPGAGGRQGLQPTSAWLRYVKLYTLAAKQVAAELRLPTMWTWGWGTFGPKGVDPDKPSAACVYLWARTGDSPLCDAAQIVPEDFEASLTEGQITLPAGVQCSLGGRSLFTGALDRLAQVTRDREVAYTILFSRLVEDGSIPAARVLAAERALVDGRFDGSRQAYLAALAKAGATLAVARGAIADEIRRAEVERTLKVQQPTEGQLAEFYRRYPDTLVRSIRAEPAPHWLGGRKRGFVLAPAAPAVLFQLETGVEATLASGLATYTVTPLEEPLPLGAVPYADVKPAIRAALVAFARGEVYDEGSRVRQEQGRNLAVCAGDDFPDVSVVSVTDYLPFLSLNA